MHWWPAFGWALVFVSGLWVAGCLVGWGMLRLMDAMEDYPVATGAAIVVLAIVFVACCLHYAH